MQILSNPICLKCMRIAEIGVEEHDGDVRPEVEIRPFSAYAMHSAIIIWTVRWLWMWLWGRYYVPQNAFLVDYVMHARSTFGWMHTINFCIYLSIYLSTACVVRSSQVSRQSTTTIERELTSLTLPTETAFPFSPTSLKLLPVYSSSCKIRLLLCCRVCSDRGWSVVMWYTMPWQWLVGSSDMWYYYIAVSLLASSEILP